MKISIGVSNRHVHLCEEDYKKLFNDEPFEVVRYLNQPGEFASNKKVTIKTDKDIIENVRVIGPIRKYTQIEISKTDSFKLGLNPPVRDSGDLEGSSGITIIGPVGEIHKENGCIIANRHIHITPEERIKYGLENIEEVNVRLDGIKGGIINHVRLKESPKYAFELHLDTDDANAHFVKQGDLATIIIEDNEIKKI
ncbi:MAG: phosphate propanoyltransferase [Bacilli bacterium]|nr:phosphate propanoyltransferase [Bacilli bacterium]